MAKSSASGFVECALLCVSALTSSKPKALASRDDLVLHLQQIGPSGIELIRPKMRTAMGIDELGVDAHPVLVPPHRAFEHVANAEFLADLLGVDALALVGEGRVARDDETVADARQIRGEVFGYAVGEIILARIARKVREWKYNNRKAWVLSTLALPVRVFPS